MMKLKLSRESYNFGGLFFVILNVTVYTNRTMYFNVTELKEFIDMVSESTFQLNF